MYTNLLVLWGTHSAVSTTYSAFQNEAKIKHKRTENDTDQVEQVDGAESEFAINHTSTMVEIFFI